MRANRKIVFLLTAIVLAALICACASGGVRGEWKDAETGMRIVFDKSGKGTLYTPMFGTELENELTYKADGDQLTIGFINADGTESTETVVVKDGVFTYLGLNFAYQSE